MAVATSYSDLQPVRRIDEAEAARISNKIDEELKAEKEMLKRRKASKRDVKVMLLGQAESGKSTLQKQFQLYYASSQLDKERPAWRPVVHFNIIKAVRMILEELDYEFTQTPTSANTTTTTATTTTARSQPVPPLPPLPPMSATARGKLPAIPGSGAAYTAARAAAANGGAGYASNTNANGSGYESSSNSSHNNHNGGGGGWQDDLAQLRTKLLPLVAVEDALARDLSGGVSVTGVSGRSGVFVRSGWQALVAPVSVRGWFRNGGGNNNSNLNSNGNGNQNGNGNAGASGGGPPVNDLVARMLAATKEEVAALWRHPNVRSIIRSRKLRLDESASFFLENVHRIAEPDYLPATEDILNVRLQTLGVKEHSFDISLSGTRVNWLLYDVGGARGQRHAWVPYFDDATAIIFLAPISAFDQYLEEDPRTNRIDDSLQLFTAICSNKLLKKTHLVLLLNKTDLLRQKLNAGIKVRKYITSYGNRPNTYEDVSEYFRAHFLQVHRRNDVSKRALYAHFTSMLDIKATQKIIVNVGEAIIRSYIADAGLT